MPKSLQYILDHADELAARAEAFVPTDEQVANAVPLARVHRAVVAAGAAQREVLEAVEAARAEGVSWAHIGNILGTSGQAAAARYSRSEVEA